MEVKKGMSILKAGRAANMSTALRMAYQPRFQEVAGAEASKQSTITGNSIMQPESHPPSQEVLRKDVHKILSACIQQLKGGGCNSAIWGSGRT